jgi:hypothetical protein
MPHGPAPGRAVGFRATNSILRLCARRNQRYGNGACLGGYDRAVTPGISERFRQQDRARMGLEIHVANDGDSVYENIVRPRKDGGRGRFAHNDMASSQIRVGLPARAAHFAHVVPAPASAIRLARLVAWVRSEPAAGAMDLQRLGTGRHLHRE